MPEAPPARWVTPFGECGLKLNGEEDTSQDAVVTPFGECGLKFGLYRSELTPELSLPLGSVG